jgi:hypothetical protein
MLVESNCLQTESLTLQTPQTPLEEQQLAISIVETLFITIHPTLRSLDQEQECLMMITSTKLPKQSEEQ